MKFNQFVKRRKQTKSATFEDSLLRKQNKLSPLLFLDIRRYST